MSMQFSHSVGYHGFAAIKANESADTTFQESGLIPLLCTGGSISLQQTPLQSNAAWGAGYMNAAQIAYAWNYMELDGSVNFDLTTGGEWEQIRRWAFVDRVYGASVKALPDGVNGYKGFGYLTSLGFNASEGSQMTCDVSFKGDAGQGDTNGDGLISGDDESDDVGIVANGTGDTSKYGAAATDYDETDDAGKNTRPTEPVRFAGATLIAYWESSLYEQVAASQVTNYGYEAADKKSICAIDDMYQMKDIMNWSASYNSDLTLLKCCTGQPNPPLGADYCVLGEMTGDGSYTIFTLKGNFKPQSFHQEKKNVVFKVCDRTERDSLYGGGVANTKYYLKMPKMFVTQGQTSMQTGSSYVQADFSFTGLGDGTGPILEMSNCTNGAFDGQRAGI